MVVCSPIVLAIDAMGGDNAPAIVIEGLSIFITQYAGNHYVDHQHVGTQPNKTSLLPPSLHFLIYGETSIVEPLLQLYPHLKSWITFTPTTDIILPDTKPSTAIRKGRQSSMGLAIQSVKEGKASGVVSAGNTGAYMALALLELRALPGIQRPAICSQIPTQRSQTVILDLGANAECTAQNLVEFAVMGELYAQEVLGLAHPKVGLLNIGSEDTKGNPVLKEAASLLRPNNHTPPLVKNFCGFIEGDDITKGTTDVVVTDGFSGNIALKAIEGTAKMIVHFLKESFQQSWGSKIAYLLAKRSLDKLLKKRLDPRYYNGAIFLGINGVVIKSHGGTDGIGFSNAIGVAVKMITNGLNEKIKAAFLQRL